MRGSVESPFEAQLQETVAMELNTGDAGLFFQLMLSKPEFHSADTLTAGPSV